MYTVLYISAVCHYSCQKSSFSQTADNLAAPLDVKPRGQGVFTPGSWTKVPQGADSFYRLATSALCLAA